MDTEEKNKSKSVSFSPELWKRVEDKASGEYGGNRSAYLRVLAEEDLNGTGASLIQSPDAVVQLARVFHPTLAPALERQLNVSHHGAAVAQPRVIALFLESLHHALKRDFDPESSFQLWSSEEALLHQFRANPALREIFTGGAGLTTVGVNEPKPSEDEIPNSPVSEELAKIRRHTAAPGAKVVARATPARIPALPPRPKG